jgi:glycosyltransferase involved in cell wall biosynthesis
MANQMPKTVCYFGTYRKNYSRNRILIKGLRAAGVEVIECHENLWHGVEDRVNTVQGGWKRPLFWFRLVRAYVRLICKYLFLPDHEILIVGYPGLLDVYAARILSWIKRKPLIWDVFMSVYLISLERGLARTNKFSVNLLFWIEKNALKLPDILIIDTEQYAAWFQNKFNIPQSRFRLVPTGADNELFKQTNVGIRSDTLFQVLYYGTYIPNHGTPFIIEAARLLASNSQICFTMIGKGPELEKCRLMVNSYALENVTFIDWLDPTDLVNHINESSICLGVFGTTPQSLMTVQNKIYECMAMKKPIVSGNSEAVQAAFENEKEIMLIDRNDPQNLADAISRLLKNPELMKAIAENGYQKFSNSYTIDCLGNLYKQHLKEVLKK